ncbi:Lrp/AsnC family transcriptional regulator [Streptomyces sp. NPDC096339]|uniref:Lrp/AsnC family transcriptional regulator n=1 Tax=Streptomyces sp. NPDC096339 TaxID=3366086 RepID=UPI00382A0515
MTGEAIEDVLDLRDQRLISALQCDGRLTAERAAEVLGLNTRVVHRRLAALLGSGTVRVTARAGGGGFPPAMLLRIRVLRGKAETVATALAGRDDIPFVDLSASGDEIGAVLLADAGAPNRLVFRQLPATSSVVSVDAQTVLHVFEGGTAADWRLDVLTPAERAALTPLHPQGPAGRPDRTDLDILAALAEDGRAPASAVARRTGGAESTVRRRLASLRERGLLLTEVHVDARRLGLHIDANLRMRVPPGELDALGRRLAGHPAVHGVLATTGSANLHVAVWLRNLAELYGFLTRDIGGLGIPSVDTFLVGRAVKRPTGPAW